uniref:Uncharacterized protein n=1 Tax=Rhizophora mucronata TaxID=61149 RepID=A0A2P2IUC6_RHIMU
MDRISAISEELADIDGQIADIFRALSNGFQKLEKIKDVNRRSRQLEELTEKMRDCKRCLGNRPCLFFKFLFYRFIVL